MRKTAIECLPLTLRELEAEQEMRDNWRSLAKPMKFVRGHRHKRSVLRAERVPLTVREREAEAENEKREMGVILPL